MIITGKSRPFSDFERAEWPVRNPIRSMGALDELIRIGKAALLIRHRNSVDDVDHTIRLVDVSDRDH